MTCTFSVDHHCAYLATTRVKVGAVEGAISLVECDGAEASKRECPLWTTRVSGTVFNEV